MIYLENELLLACSARQRVGSQSYSFAVEDAVFSGMRTSPGQVINEKTNILLQLELLF